MYCRDDNFDFNKCSFHFLTSKKKHIGKFGNNIFGYEIKEYNTPIERFTNISTWDSWIQFININLDTDPKFILKVLVWNSKGQTVFQIVENCGILKYRLQMSPSMLYDTIVPSVVKKHVIG